MKEYENVVLLSIDALRKDRINGDYDREVAPFLSKLADENTEFVNCISTSSHTREAMSSMLTGVYPYKANKEGHIPSGAPGGGFHLDGDTVASYLNVKTGGFHSNPFLSRSFGYGKDWSKFDDDLYLGNSKVLTLLNRFLEKITNRHYSRADKINKKSLKWIDSINSEDFFLWNHYMDPHGPYQPPKEFKGIYQDDPLTNREAQKLLKKAINNPEEISDSERQSLIDLYDEEIRYTDQRIKDFFDRLKEKEILEETLVIIVGDHGEVFGEEGFYEHGGALTEELVRVPLIIVDGKDRTVETSTSLVDIVPTVLRLFNSESEDLDGEDLLEIADNPEKFQNRTVFCQETKNDNLLFGCFSKEKLKVLDYNNDETSSDSNLGDKVADYARKVQNDVKDSESKDEVEEEVKERLEALGYMEDKSR